MPKVASGSFIKPDPSLRQKEKTKIFAFSREKGTRKDVSCTVINNPII
jgi:hypothetical protein